MAFSLVTCRMLDAIFFSAFAGTQYHFEIIYESTPFPYAKKSNSKTNFSFTSEKTSELQITIHKVVETPPLNDVWWWSIQPWYLLNLSLFCLFLCACVCHRVFILLSSMLFTSVVWSPFVLWMWLPYHVWQMIIITIIITDIYIAPLPHVAQGRFT